MKLSLTTFSIAAIAVLSVNQAAFADGCDVPMFAAGRMFATPGGPKMLATADFNHDGFTDIAVIAANSVVSILLGNGDGTFQAAVNYPAGSSPSWLGVADFNGDGNTDLAIAAGASTSILLGTGDGRFRPPATVSGIAVGGIGDFNGDGKPDLTDGFGIALGKGDGTFQPAVRGSVLQVAGAAAVADVNGDGKLDVIAADVASSTIVVLLGDGKGGLAAPVKAGAAAAHYASYLTMADLNGDGKPDIVAYYQVDNTFAVLLGSGNGAFQAATNYPLPGMGPSSTSVLVADLNGDGIPDVAATSTTALSATGTISIYAGNGDGTFLDPVQYNPKKQPIWWLAAADFNGDGLLDLVFSDNVTRAPTEIGVMLGSPGGTFQSPVSYAAGDIPRSPVVADFNGDGIADIAVVSAGLSANISVLLGNGDGTFQAAVNYPATFGTKSLAAGDVNGDGKIDLVAANGVSPGFKVFLGNGDGTFQDPRTVNGPLGIGSYIALGDFNNDGNLDVAALGFGVSIMLGNGDGTFRAGMGPFGPTSLSATSGADLGGGFERRRKPGPGAGAK